MRADLGSGEGRRGSQVTHVDTQVLVRVNLRGKEQQIARLFALLKGGPES
jgi:hypothetical protein